MAHSMDRKLVAQKQGHGREVKYISTRFHIWKELVREVVKMSGVSRRRIYLSLGELGFRFSGDTLAILQQHNKQVSEALQNENSSMDDCTSSLWNYRKSGSASQQRERNSSKRDKSGGSCKGS